MCIRDSKKPIQGTAQDDELAEHLVRLLNMSKMDEKMDVRSGSEMGSGGVKVIPVWVL